MFVFSRFLFKFSRVIQSNSYLAKTAMNVFLNFIVLLCPFSFCSQSVFLLYFHAVFPALYNNLCTKTTLNATSYTGSFFGEGKTLVGAGHVPPRFWVAN